MSMPNAWIERLFARLLARYGSAWINLWAGVPAQAMIADWGRVLDGVPAHMLAYGLDNLPDRPPNATQFRAICVQHPARPLPALPPPPADPAIAAAVLGAITRPTGRDPKQWAYDLRASSNPLTFAQREMVRNALHQE